MQKRTLQITVRREPGGYWAEVPELEGCFADRATLDELLDALHDNLSLYLGADGPAPILSRLVGWQLEIEPDLKPAGPTPTHSHGRVESVNLTATTGRRRGATTEPALG